MPKRCTEVLQEYKGNTVGAQGLHQKEEEATQVKSELLPVRSILSHGSALL